MSSSAQTRIFGIRLGLDPKILVGALIAVAALLFWYNSRSDESGGQAPAAAAASRKAQMEAVTEAPAEAKRDRVAERRRSTNRSGSETLRLRNIDATHGDIDPELRLDMLASLEKVKPPTNSRDLFEEGAAVATGGVNGLPVRKIVPAALQAPVLAPQYPTPSQMQVNVPYKYYGFVKPKNPGESNRGFFLDGDKILVGAEGQLLQERYLVVQLSPTSARVQDTQLKQDQTLAVVPQAVPSEAGGYGTPGMGYQNDASEDMQESEPQMGQRMPGQPMRINPGMNNPGMNPAMRQQQIRGGNVTPMMSQPPNQ